MPEISGGFKIPDMAELSLTLSTKGPEVSLKTMYSKLSKALPNWSVLRGYNIPPPVLFVDEANRLDYLLSDGDGNKGTRVLNDFFAWVVENSKEANRFHVIMASSDSFFLKWLNQFIDSGSFVNFFMGHLPQRDAKKFWEQLESKRMSNVIKPLEFFDANKVCGGSIHLMKIVHKLYYASNGTYCPHDLSQIDTRRLEFFQALHSPLWQPSDLLWLMESIITCENKSFGYDTIAKKISSKSIDSMIQSNLFHLRPCLQFDFDLDSDHNFVAPVIMPHLPYDVIIMKEILDHQKRM